MGFDEYHYTHMNKIVKATRNVMQCRLEDIKLQIPNIILFRIALIMLSKRADYAHYYAHNSFQLEMKLTN